MKFLAIAGILLVLMGTSCKKYVTDPALTTTGAGRKVQFVLYTDKNFSTDNHNITFTLLIENATGHKLWDSVMATMKVKDIPNMANKIVAEKTVPNDDGSQLKVSFQYYLENIGYSWYLDSVKTGETFKTVNYNFQ